MWLWLRRLVRRHTNPIPLTTAEKWHLRLSLFYGFVVWNTTGFVLYYTFTSKEKWAEIIKASPNDELMPPSERYAKLLGIKKAHVIQVSGLKRVKEYDIDDTPDETDSD